MWLIKCSPDKGILIHPTPRESLATTVREALDYGIFHEPIARKKYLNILRHEFKRDVEIRETGLLIQPNLFWALQVLMD